MILKLREIAKNFLKFQVGDRSDIYLWIESWHPDGILFDKYGFRFIYDAGRKLDAKLKLSSVIRGRDWHWLPARSVSMVAISSCKIEG